MGSARGFYQAGAIALTVFGCNAPVKMHLEQALRGATDNPVAVEGTYHGRPVEVSGTVYRTGFVTRIEEVIETRTHGSSRALGGVVAADSGSTTSKTEIEHRLPYVELGTGNPSDGVAVCMYKSGEAKLLTDIQTGGSVLVNGWFTRIREGVPPTIVLTHCDIENLP